MKNEKVSFVSPILCGLIGSLATVAATLLGSVICAAAFVSVADPNSFVLICACIAMFLGGAAGGILSVKLGNAFISATVSAVASLLILAAVSMFFPASDGVLSRILPPVILTLSTLVWGYVSLGRKPTRADTLKKAVKKAKK